MLDSNPLRERLARLNQPGRVVAYEELILLLNQFDAATGALTVHDVVAFRKIAARQRGLFETSDALTVQEREQRCAEWQAVEQVFEQQMASALPPDEKTKIEGLLERQANLEQASHLIEAATSQTRAGAIKWPRGGLLGLGLILAGVVSLLFGWPSGSLVGAILLLAGVIALKGRPSQLSPEDEFRAAAKRLVASFDIDERVKRYEKAVNTDKVIDFAALNRSLRERFGWPEHGSIMGHEGATEEINTILTTIEAQGGRVPIRQAILMQSVLDAEGPEAFFVRERAKRGYPPL